MIGFAAHFCLCNRRARAPNSHAVAPRSYDVSWAAFNVVEVMSQTKFAGKRVGYTAAAQSFNEVRVCVCVCVCVHCVLCVHSNCC